MPTSARAVLHHTDPNGPNILKGSVSNYYSTNIASSQQDLFTMTLLENNGNVSLRFHSGFFCLSSTELFGRCKNVKFRNSRKYIISSFLRFNSVKRYSRYKLHRKILVQHTNNIGPSLDALASRIFIQCKKVDTSIHSACQKT